MEKKQSKKNNRMEKRIKTVHSRAQFAGFLYLIGTLALAVFAFLPLFTFGESQWSVTNFYAPFLSIAESPDWIEVAKAAFYALLLLVSVINALICLGCLGKLYKKTHKSAKRCNDNAKAMKKMAGAFSSSFATLIIMYFQMYLLYPQATVITVDLMAYIALGAAVAVHLLAGLAHGYVSNFEPTDEKGVMDEEKRQCSMFVYFFRNLVQLAAVGGILYYFMQNNCIYDVVSTLVAGGNPIEGKEIMPLISMALQVLVFLCSLVLIKHATAATEFNLYGIEGKGMKNYRVFSFLVFLFAAGVAVLTYLQDNTVIPMDYIIIAGAAFVAFLVDCIFKSKPREPQVEVDVDDDSLHAVGEANAPTEQTAQPIHAQPIYIPIYYYSQAIPAPCPAQPAPYPYGAPAAPVAPVAPVAENNQVDEMGRPLPAPAPSYITPTPAPEEVTESKNELREKRRELSERKKGLAHAKKQAKVNERIAKRNQKEEARQAKAEEKFNRENAAVATEIPVVEEAELAPVEPVVAPVVIAPETNVQAPVEPDLDEVKEIPLVLDPNKTWKVRCPRCGKELNIRETSPYHRCPACGNVFTIRKFETYKKK